MDRVDIFQFWGVLPIWIIVELIMLASGGLKEVPLSKSKSGVVVQKVAERSCFAMTTGKLSLSTQQ